jgi:NodT family efflux transporter outer membrane factor (OMF) lipoprotein
LRLFRTARFYGLYGRMSRRSLGLLLALATAFAVTALGCTTPLQYIHNGLKVGPNYKTPPAPIAEHWIDAVDKRVRSEEVDLSCWWTVFNDPILGGLIVNATQQNLTLREAGFRVLEARAQLGIARGNFFPQTQTLSGAYTRFAVPGVTEPTYFSQWNYGFNLAWQLDFWGAFRRAIIAADDALQASVFDYDDVMITLLGDVATSYVQYRTDQERIRLLRQVVQIQENVLKFISEQLTIGFHGVTNLDRAQALSNLKQSEAQIAELQIDMRVQQNNLCTLLGIPTQDLETYLNSGLNKDIPVTPDYVIVGIPADLLRRRPDVRRAERLAAAQAEQIGIAETAWYPAFTISGTLGGSAATFSDLFKPSAFNSNVGPSFQWNLLNYGRIVNNVRFQDATFKELVVAYQQSVLNADQEVENGIVTFLKAQEREQLLRQSVDAAYLALEVIIAQYENPTQAAGAGADFNRYAVIQQNLITQQDLWVQSRGEIALGLIQVYEALGGGWVVPCDRSPQQALSDGKPVDKKQQQNPEPETLQTPQPAPPAADEGSAIPMPLPSTEPSGT